MAPLESQLSQNRERWASRCENKTIVQVGEGRATRLGRIVLNIMIKEGFS
jgi:hypothetical protein